MLVALSLVASAFVFALAVTRHGAAQHALGEGAAMSLGASGAALQYHPLAALAIETNPLLSLVRLAAPWNVAGALPLKFRKYATTTPTGFGSRLQKTTRLLALYQERDRAPHGSLPPRDMSGTSPDGVETQRFLDDDAAVLPVRGKPLYVAWFESKPQGAWIESDANAHLVAATMMKKPSSALKASKGVAELDMAGSELGDCVRPCPAAISAGPEHVCIYVRRLLRYAKIDDPTIVQAEPLESISIGSLIAEAASPNYMRLELPTRAAASLFSGQLNAACRAAAASAETYYAPHADSAAAVALLRRESAPAASENTMVKSSDVRLPPCRERRESGVHV